MSSSILASLTPPATAAGTLAAVAADICRKVFPVIEHLLDLDDEDVRNCI
jgi:hypothetical protein